MNMKFLKQFTNTQAALMDVDGKSLLIEVDDILRKKLQSVLLDMLRDVLRVCSDYNIDVFLLGGTALGAVRHKGFIPWDDDIDIGMTREAYVRFKKVFEETLGEKYVLNAPNYSKNAKARFPKILKKGTILKEILDTQESDLNRVFLDIFILENTPANGIVRRAKGIYCELLEIISSMVFFYENADQETFDMFGKVSRANVWVRLALGKVFSFKKSASWFDTVDRAIQYPTETGKKAIPTGRKHYFGEILDADELFPLTTAEFEGEQVPVFKNNDYYLRNLYGNYMEIPPVEKRERHFIKKIAL